MTLEETVLAHTTLARPPLVPELELYLVTEACPLWCAGEDELARLGLGEPFWAFCWPGGQALARYLFDNPAEAWGRRVLDVGAGCGVEALAAAARGARSVLAADIDPLACAACRLNATRNGLAVATFAGDPIGRGAEDRPDEDDQLILVGDLFYEATLARRLHRWLTESAARGARVLIGDPHRGFLPQDCLVPVAEYDAPSDVDVGGRYLRRTGVFALAA